MNFDKFELNPSIEQEKTEKTLSPEEIEELEGDMTEYLKGLEERIKEIKKEIEESEGERKSELEEELEELNNQYEGLTEFVEDINSNNYEEITEKPHKD